MMANVSGWYTDIYLSLDEVKELCKPGEGANTCSWLLHGSHGFECCYHHKNPSLLKRHEEKSMIALRDGCYRVKQFNPVGMSMGIHEI